MIQPKNWQIDKMLKVNYDIVLNEAIPNNWDCIIIVFGKEGSGKTTCASQGCFYMDKGFNNERVAFLPEHFESVVEKSEPGSSILWDEAITGISAADWATKVSQSIVKKLTQIRKKRLKIFICFPYLHMINKYLISRCIGSLYIYSIGFKKRGLGYFYNQEQTESLYYSMKMRYGMIPTKAIPKSDIAFKFKFQDWFPLNIEEYESDKDKARIKEEIEIDIWKQRFIKVVDYTITNKLLDRKIVGEIVSLTPAYIGTLMNNNSPYPDEDLNEFLTFGKGKQMNKGLEVDY